MPVLIMPIDFAAHLIAIGDRSVHKISGLYYLLHSVVTRLHRCGVDKVLDIEVFYTCVHRCSLS